MAIEPCGAKPRSGAERFYRFTDEHGRLHIVGSASQVPPAFQQRAECIEATPDGASRPVTIPEEVGGVDVRSFALGAGLVAAVWLAARLLRGRGSIVFRIALTAGVVAALAGLYFGLLRKQAALGDGSFVASPGALVEDARRATADMQRKLEERERLLREIERDAKR